MAYYLNQLFLGSDDWLSFDNFSSWLATKVGGDGEGRQNVVFISTICFLETSKCLLEGGFAAFKLGKPSKIPTHPIP